MCEGEKVFMRGRNCVWERKRVWVVSEMYRVRSRHWKCKVRVGVAE